MTSAYTHLIDDHLSAEEKILRLQQLNSGLAESLRRLSNFQKQVLTIKQSSGVDGALDQMELLLEEVLDFTYARLYMRDDGGELRVERNLCPYEVDPDRSLVDWVSAHQELAIIPQDAEAVADGIRSLLLLPLAGHARTVGILILWLASDHCDFTQEQSTLLMMLARETASVIEAHQFRGRIENARAAIEDVVESVPHGILQVDGSGTINLINSTMEFMLDVRRDSVLAKHYREALPESVSSFARRMFECRLDEEQEVHMLVRGTEEVLGLTLSPMRAAAGIAPAGHVLICRDLAMSREILKLRELDAMKNDFLSLVSHELRTPLTSIMAYSETLLMEGMVETEEERREYLQIIHDEGARLSRLINDVLDLTKMEAGKMDYSFGDQDVNQIARNSIQSSRSLLESKGLEVVEDLSPELPAVRADADRIMQVMMNFLSNAIKFTESGGRITVRSRLAPGEAGKSVDSITVSVQDTGIGIAPEQLDRVFAKFEQIENIDHHSVGTGLGMPICKQIIEDGHGGAIWIESAPGEGTTVSFRIPVS